MNNKTAIDALHDLLPKHLNTKHNPNWKALINAIGSADQDTASLVAEVRKQFFIKTASRPYLDRLAANNMIARPRLVGMDDPSFRQYIPVLSYKPKQVKLIIDQLLDIFFFKESTTAFITSQNAEPIHLQDGWEFEYVVDEINDERIQFTASQFTDITNATANEVVAAINRQTKYSYATAEYDSITKNTYIRLFSNTIGSKGSLRIIGGRANVALRFNGFIDTAGNGLNTQWVVTKVGDQVVFQYSSGQSPEVNQLQVGDVAIINLTGNIGSFYITNVDLVNQAFTITNLFGTAGTFTQIDATQVKFLRPNKFVAFINPRRAMTWETAPGEITIEMPTSPPVVKRSLKGSVHLNGASSKMLSRDSDNSMTILDATDFPNGGTFWLEPIEAITTHYITPTENSTGVRTNNARLIGEPQKYIYTSRTAASTTGNSVIGSNQLTVISAVGIAAGQQIVMTGIPSYAVVQSVVGNIVNIDRASTQTLNGVGIIFLGNQLTGITPNLPSASAMNELTNSSISRTNGVVTVTTSSSHIYQVGDPVILTGSLGIAANTTTATISLGSNLVTGIVSVSGLAKDMLISGIGIPVGAKIINVVGNTATMDQSATANGATTITISEDLNGGHIVTGTTLNSYTFTLLGLNGVVTTVGTSRIEKFGLATSGTKIYATEAISSSMSRIIGSYIWDLAAPFVLSSHQGAIGSSIQAGKIVRLLNLGTNDIPVEGGFLMFDYGLNTQEGPVRYLYKPTTNTVAIDPSYTFKYNHSSGSKITLISKSGPHIMSTFANEYPAYVTDPSQARLILEDLIRSVKSAGIFVNFLVRYPEELYGIFDIYNQQGLGAGAPFTS